MNDDDQAKLDRLCNTYGLDGVLRGVVKWSTTDGESDGVSEAITIGILRGILNDMDAKALR